MTDYFQFTLSSPDLIALMTDNVEFFFLGKMAAGKSTLTRNWAVRGNAVLLVQDDFLNALFPGEITDIPAFVDR